MAALARLGKLVAPSSALFVCDIQERFVPVIHNMPAVVDTAKRMIRAATLLDLPIVVTEQYPKVRVWRFRDSVQKAVVASTALTRVELTMACIICVACTKTCGAHSNAHCKAGFIEARLLASWIREGQTSVRAAAAT